ncbi:MAG: hypothetical protein M3N16_03260 [Actinomycetota bacterium]|nr:hypothetical protein [Actinomycetota bacterium]
MTLRFMAATTAACLVLGGCGASEEERAETAVREYNAAFAKGDGKKACARLSRGFKAQVPNCDRFVSELSRADPSGEPSRRLAEADYEVTVRGDHATAENAELGSFELVKEDGEWRISSAR